MYAQNLTPACYTVHNRQRSARGGTNALPMVRSVLPGTAVYSTINTIIIGISQKHYERSQTLFANQHRDIFCRSKSNTLQIASLLAQRCVLRHDYDFLQNDGGVRQCVLRCKPAFILRENCSEWSQNVSLPAACTTSNSVPLPIICIPVKYFDIALLVGSYYCSTTILHRPEWYSLYLGGCFIQIRTSVQTGSTLVSLAEQCEYYQYFTVASNNIAFFSKAYYQRQLKQYLPNTTRTLTSVWYCSAYSKSAVPTERVPYPRTLPQYIWQIPRSPQQAE